MNLSMDSFNTSNIKLDSNQININGDENDLFYRYKMPAVKLDFNKKMKRTIITNSNDIGNSLSRDHKLICKFLAKSMSTQAVLNDGNIVINGIFTDQEIQQQIYAFIQKYVLCGKCNNPETDISKKKDSLQLLCKACGYNKNIKLSDGLDKIIYNSLSNL